MAFNFFTFGGKTYWADIFFYQKWRIQRHINSKTYRLLDPWDISRAAGTLESCIQQFIKYTEVYEIPRQKGQMVIMLHGFGENKKIFRPLWNELEKYGFISVALNYPSTKDCIDSHVKQLDFFLNNVEDVSDISFVAKGESCLILRKLFTITSDWQEKLHIKRILFINPTNSGSDFFPWLSKFKLFRWLLGPMAQEISSAEAIMMQKLPNNIEQGTIFCETKSKKIADFCKKKFESIPIIDGTCEQSYVEKSIDIENNKLKIFDNIELVHKCILFLRTGAFR